MSPLAVGRSFGGLSAPPVTCPYRAEQATGLAGGHDFGAFYKAKGSNLCNATKFFIFACFDKLLRKKLLTNQSKRAISKIQNNRDSERRGVSPMGSAAESVTETENQSNKGKHCVPEVE